MTERPTVRFSPGDLVRRRSSPEMFGRVLESFWDPQVDEWDVRVQFGTQTIGVGIEDLEPFVVATTPWEQFVQRRLSGARHFRDLVTFERLRRPPARIADSFGTARAQLLPYQFVPLLKFLDNPSRRLLIADDVGLGKTIEAGYILRELRRHRDLDRVLIVVPARLRTKWKTELLRRFDEHFDLVGRTQLHDFVRGLRAGRPREDFCWITSYESARGRLFTEALDEFEPPIDLIIFDEAHRLRNPGTLQNQLARKLAGCAEALLFLTATPVQTSLENLFELFRLLDPERFESFETFAEQIEANRPVIRALASLRASGEDRNAAAGHLEFLRENRMTAALTKGEFFDSIMSRAARASDLSRRDLVILQQDVAELSLTGSLISRTKKRDVQKNRPQREAQSHQIEPSAEEMEIYGLVQELCEGANPALRGWGAAMKALMSYRMAASCIPAALEAFREQLGRSLSTTDFGLRETESETGWLEKPEEEPEADEAGDPIDFGALLGGLAQPAWDSKLRTFETALQTIWAADAAEARPRRKVVVFAFFKRTLKFLARQLESWKVAYRLIDGDVPIPEREARIEDFSSDPEILVLLSSEVGGEGLDLQFASVVVNYDLPWNPMVLEQRIGRIDRIGQKSQTITIVNLILKGTVEDRILNRLYTRIGLFEETIGEIDPILGQKVQELAINALLGKLTPEEEQQQLAEAETAIATGMEHARQLVEEADGLLAADQAFLDEVDALLGRRRIPTREETHAFLRNYLEATYLGASVPEETLQDVGEVRIPLDVATRAAQSLLGDNEVQRVARRIEGGPFPATFSPEAAEMHPRAEFLGPRHPLVRLAVDDMGKRAERINRAFALRLRREKNSDSHVPPGAYLFSISLLSLMGLQTRRELVPVFLLLGGNEPIAGDAGEELVVQLLERAESLDPAPEIPEELLPAARESLRRAFREIRRSREARERELETARALRRRQSLDATLTSRVTREERRLAALRERKAASFAIQMAEARLDKARRLREQALSRQEQEKFHMEDEEIVSGILVVE